MTEPTEPTPSTGLPDPPDPPVPPVPPEPTAPPTPSPPPIGGTRPGASPDVARAFFNGTALDDLGLGDAISSAFRALTKPGYFLPLFLLSIVVTLTLEAALGPLVRDRLLLDSSAIQARLPLILSSAIVAVIGSIISSAYGQVWLVLATRQAEPSVSEVVRGTVDRLLAVLGTGLAVGALLMLIIVPTLFVLREPFLLLIIAPLIAYLGSRLAFATWLAADGRGPIEAVRESWEISRGRVLRIFGWNFVFGLVVLTLSFVLGLVLDRFAVGSAILQGITVGMEFGFGIALYRKLQAEAQGEPQRDSRGYL